MPRETYTLSSETLAVLGGNVKQIAEEMGKSDKYLYAILAGTETDVFAKFKPEYAAAVRAGAPVGHWDAWFAGVRERYAARREPVSAVEILCDKLRSDTETSTHLAQALRDGRIDRREGALLMMLVSRERDVLDQIERMVLGTAEVGI